MDVLDTGDVRRRDRHLRQRWNDYDFFFLHYKTPTRRRDGDFDAKVAALERFDAQLPPS